MHYNHEYNVTFTTGMSNQSTQIKLLESLELEVDPQWPLL